MRPAPPAVSVVSVWYNQTRYLERFVRALDAQTFKDFELIVVDDGSSDGLSAALDAACRGSEFDRTYVRRQDEGFTLNTSRNYGLALARGDCVVFLDGDMQPSAELVERHFKNIESGAQCSVGTRIRAPHLGVASDERYHVFLDGSWSAKPFLYAFGCNLAIQRSFLVERRISFDESYNGRYGLDDIDLAYRCHKAGATFVYDVYAAATHLPVDHPDMSKLDQCLDNFEQFRRYHFVTGIVQSGPVFFEHKYNAGLYQRIIGGEVTIDKGIIRIESIPANGGRPIAKDLGHGRPTFIIAEAGLNHNGSIAIARRLVEVASLAGADCIKFQKRDVDQMATRLTYDTTPTPLPELGETYRAVREKHELTFEEFSELKGLAEQLGLIFMITPFDLQSVEFCERLGVTCYKLASHSMTDLPTVRKVAETGKPLFMSTGMSTPEEVDLAVKTVRDHHDQLVLMHCVSSYPQRDEDTNLSVIDYLRDRYRCLVGYSGHEHGTVITAASVLKHAVAVERHITLDKRMLGFDHGLSLTPQELMELCQQIRSLEKALGTPEKRVLASEQKARLAYRRSLVTVGALKKGHRLIESDLTVKEPGTGIPPYEINRVVGRRVAVDLDADVTVEERHLE